MSRTSLFRALAGAALTVLVAGCQGDRLTSPADTEAVTVAPQARAARAEEGRITVMTRNLYVGAAVEDVFPVPDDQIPVAALRLWEHVLATDFGERAQAVAAEVARHRPHLIGLQEVSKFRMVVGQDAGGPIWQTVLDFEPTLLAALGAAGLTYVSAAETGNFSAEVPMLLPGSTCLADDSCSFPACVVAGTCDFTFIGLDDSDLVLVRSDVAWSNPMNARFATVLGPPFVPIPLYRGWASVDVVISDLSFRFGVTHLEPADDDEGNVIPPLEGIQRAQGAEFRASLEAGGVPVIAVGDLNTDAYGASTQTYGDFLTAGYEDAWAPGGAGGWTCCQEEDLRTWPSILDRRVDLIFMKGDFGLGPKGVLGGVQASLVGGKGSDRTPSGLWPSDHAGVVASLFLRKP